MPAHRHSTHRLNCLRVLSADALIVNYETSIGQMFQEYGPQKDILFSKDYGGNSIVNAGKHILGLAVLGYTLPDVPVI